MQFLYSPTRGLQCSVAGAAVRGVCHTVHSGPPLSCLLTLSSAQWQLLNGFFPFPAERAATSSLRPHRCARAGGLWHSVPWGQCWVGLSSLCPPFWCFIRVSWAAAWPGEHQSPSRAGVFVYGGSSAVSLGFLDWNWCQDPLVHSQTLRGFQRWWGAISLGFETLISEHNPDRRWFTR